MKRPKPFQSIIPVVVFISCILNMSYHHICLRIDAMLECCFPFSGVCFFAIEHESEIEWTTSRTNTCPWSIIQEEEFQRSISILGYQRARQASDPMFSKCSNFCYLSHRFKCLLSVVRVILSYACSCRLNFLIHCS
jgi:hypothetical protein